MRASEPAPTSDPKRRAAALVAGDEALPEINVELKAVVAQQLDIGRVWPLHDVRRWPDDLFAELVGQQEHTIGRNPVQGAGEHVVPIRVVDEVD